jgi:tetratricopeptide (TPR) repeat protein
VTKLARHLLYICDAALSPWNIRTVSKIVLNSALLTLSYAKGASWNSTLMCSPNTRVALLEDIWKWVDTADPTKAAEIFWLCDVAGSGKSTVAHTFAQQCHEKGLLASSFFFDREIHGCNGPQKIFNTIARDLAGLNPALAEDIAAVLDQDCSIASANLTRQFQALILEPAHRHSFTAPVVIVVDALDEILGGDIDTELLGILSNQMAKLPGMFRIFLTSRPKREIDVFLAKRDHILLRLIDIHSAANLSDIGIYVRLKLKEIATWGDLGEEWPDQLLLDNFTRTAEGLFIWVSTVCNYVRTTTNPSEELRRLVLKRSPQGLPAEEKMDKLYLTILQTCNWRDEEFVRGYDLLLGAIMAAKSPLSMSALQSLHGDRLKFPGKKILQPLSALLTGLAEMDQPVRILHQSFRDFITVRAQLSSDSRQFFLCEKTHNQRVTLLCLEVLDRELTDNIYGTGYLGIHDEETPGIPEISEITEQLWYACKFWIDHIIEVQSPASNQLTTVLRDVMSRRLVLWMEVITSKDKFPGLYRVNNWLQVRTDPNFHSLTWPNCRDQAIAPSDYNLHDAESFASVLLTISSRLSYMNRREEALTAIQEAVELYRQLAANRSVAFNSHLAKSLNNLSVHLANLSYLEAALIAIQEAVEIHRHLVADQPATFHPDVPRYSSTHWRSSHLSNLGCREGAPTMIQDAMELHRQSTADQPVTFNPDLAMSLNNLSNRLSDLGCREDALTAIGEAVELRRQLAADQPATFNPDLASSLNNLSRHLSNLGRPDDALRAIQEAVELRRQLAAKQPAAFNPDLALSLHNLSNRLSDLGYLEDALRVIQEAVELRRQLAADRPAAFNLNLAMSLNILSISLSDLGRREDALSAVQEAVELLQRPAADQPVAFNPHLAMVLNNLSSRLSDLGCQEDALTAIQGAVDLRRQLVAGRSATFHPDLAKYLNTLSNTMSYLGRQKDALSAIQEAVDLHRQLAADRPAVFNPDLAMSLNNFSNRLSDFDCQEDALIVIREAIELRRELAADRPVAYNRDLAESLNNLSACLSDLCHQEEALKASQEAVELYRQLTADRPAALNPGLALSLSNLSVNLSKLGHKEDALTVIREAVGLHRHLAADQPAAFNPNLALSLNNLSYHLSNLGHQEEALTVIQEAVEMRRQLAEVRPVVFNLDLAQSLSNLCECLFHQGRRGEALKAAQDAAGLA